MRVLMLGWDFSPRLSGGVGSACQGLASALARTKTPLATEVVFVLPRLRGDEEPESVRLLAGDAAAMARAATPPTPAAPVLAAVGSAPAPARTIARTAPPTPRARAHAAVRADEREEPLPELLPEAPPPLPSASEALRLLAIDSPLRPYLSQSDYAEVVRALLARIQGAPAAKARAERRPAPPPATGAEPRAPFAASQAPTAAPVSLPELPVPLPEAPAPLSELPVPPYGRTLLAEVERYARAALALAQRESFDLIHAHDWMTFPAALLLKEHTGKPLVVHFHSCEAERRGPLATRDARAVEQAALDAAERVLCVSEASGRTLRAHYAFEYAKLRVLHNAYSPLDPGPDATEHAEPVVLYLGRLSEQKSPDVFLEAAARVHARWPQARFVLAGEGELYPELVARAEELGLSDQVTFTGFVSGEDLARTYAAADVYVLSSSAEPFGISALEALSLGVPTIVPQGAGVTEVVRSVLRFEPGDAGALADKIVALLERPALRRQLSTAGLREVKKLRWERPARALRGIYDELVPAAPAGAAS
jgi:glycosyltransferase involved in cell wall biosynthesis